MFVCDETDVGRNTRLTIDWGGGIKSNEVEDYGHEGAQTRKGVDLPNEKFNSSP